MHFTFDIGMDAVPELETVWLLPCTADLVQDRNELETRHNGATDLWEPIAHGLALELVNEKEQVYKRVGVFRVWEVGIEERTWHALGFVNTRVTRI